MLKYVLLMMLQTATITYCQQQMNRWVRCIGGWKPVSGGKLSQCQFVHHKPYKAWPWIKPRPPLVT